MCRFQQSLGPFAMFFVEEASKTGFYRHLLNDLSRRRQIRKYIGYEDHIFFENAQNLMYILKMQRKIEKKSVVSEIIVSESVVLICLYEEGNTSHRQSMC